MLSIVLGARDTLINEAGMTLLPLSLQYVGYYVDNSVFLLFKNKLLIFLTKIIIRNLPKEFKKHYMTIELDPVF